MNQLLSNVTFLVYFRILPSKQHFLLLVLAYWMESLSLVKIRTRNSRDPTQGNFQRLKSNYNVTLVITIKNTQYNTSLYILYINTEVIISAKSPKMYHLGMSRAFIISEISLFLLMI